MSQRKSSGHECLPSLVLAMEGQSDKSSAMSDSGGLIDLSGVSATGSGTPSSKNGDSSTGMALVDVQCLILGDF